jgi:HEPN domain-containing protein
LLRQTDSNNPGDWIWLAESDLEGLRNLAGLEIAYPLCRSKLAEVFEKVLKAELIRSGWFLEKTHDLEKLLDCLKTHSPDLVSQGEPLCDALAEVYFTGRYPGFDFDEPNWPELRRQIK